MRVFSKKYVCMRMYFKQCFTEDKKWPMIDFRDSIIFMKFIIRHEVDSR